MKIRLLLILLDAFFCAPKKKPGRRGKKKMNLNSKLTEIKREMEELGIVGKRLSTQHSSIIRSLDELKRSKATGSGSIREGGSGSGDSGGETSNSYLDNQCLKHCWMIPLLLINNPTNLLLTLIWGLLPTAPTCDTSSGKMQNNRVFDCDDNCHTCRCVCRWVPLSSLWKDLKSSTL